MPTSSTAPVRRLNKFCILILIFYLNNSSFGRLSNDGRLEMSQVEFSLSELPHVGRIFFELFQRLHLIKVIKRKGDHITCNNFTLINLMLLMFGPTYEETLTTRLLILQVLNFRFLYDKITFGNYLYSGIVVYFFHFFFTGDV